VSFTVRELPLGETELAFGAMRALRPQLSGKAEFVARVDERQRPQGYRLVAALPNGGGPAAAVAGFRELDSLAWGHAIYVDDLSTAPDSRRAGLAGRLIGWLLEEAGRLGCDALHLDSGFGPSRTDAHRLYFNSGLAVIGLHFARAV
jgi:GNAT superfamily N-acetyltransferase